MQNGSPPTSRVSLTSWLSSLLYWLAVFSAVGMYALVALSPKVLTWQDERSRWRRNQDRLVRLEQKVEHLKQVATALESDPEFAGELARVELNASRPGDERLPVEQRLALAAGAKRGTRNGERGCEEGPSQFPAISALGYQLSYESELRRFAEDPQRRRWTLLAAAGLVVFAFTFLQPSGSGQRRPADPTDDRAFLRRRYGRAPIE